MQWHTNITANFIARERPCPSPHLAEEKKDEEPPTVLMKLVMYHCDVFGPFTLQRGTDWTASFASHGRPREWWDEVPIRGKFKVHQQLTRSVPSSAPTHSYDRSHPTGDTRVPGGNWRTSLGSASATSLREPP